MDTRLITVDVSSLVLNAANFLLFDLVLAAAVYYLTADLAGLANSMSALQGSGEAISFYSPAFVGVGVGITCTKRRVFYILALVRLMSMFFIFISSMSFVGRTDCLIAEKQANVTVLGNFGRHEDYNTLAQRRILREGCQGRTKFTSYYGEIRDGSVCESNLARIPTPIHFGFFSENKTTDLLACTWEILEESEYRCDTQPKDVISCRYSSIGSKTTNCAIFGEPETPCIRQGSSNKTFVCGNNSKPLRNCRRDFRYKYMGFRCQNAILNCLLRKNTNPCVGSINIQNVTHLCEGGGTRDEGILPILVDKASRSNSVELQNQTFLCKKAEGAEWNLTDWMPYMFRDVYSMKQAYSAMYGSGSERRTVKIQKGKKVTDVSPFWVAMFVLKLATILILAGTVLALRKWKGYKRVANDEVGLGFLLLASTTPLQRLMSSDRNTTSRVRSNDIFVEMEEDVVQLTRPDEEDDEKLKH